MTADSALPTPSRVLFVLTSHDVLGEDGRPTGFHLGETVRPWRIVRAAGHEVDFASPRGGRPPMIGHDPDDAEQHAFLADPEVKAKLDRTLTPEEIDADRYTGIFFVGGHGAMWDFRENTALASLTRRIHESGGVVAAICHGPAALVDVTLSDGSFLVEGKQLTAFADAHEETRGLAQVVPFLLQSALEERGAVYSCAPDKVGHVVVSGRLVTGQNPASATGLGERLVALLGRG